MPPTCRPLNDYECMLATSTCNVGIIIDGSTETLKQAWRQCIAEFEFLQCRLVDTGEMGPLGPRYKLQEVNDDNQIEKLWKVSSNIEEDLTDHLRRVGTSSLQIKVGTYAVDCIEVKDTQKIQMVISLCHAVSDGPGAVLVASRFSQIVSGGPATTNPAQPLLDLQAELAKENVPEGTFDDIASFSNSLADEDTKSKALLPEAKQGITSEDDADKIPMSIHFEPFTLSAEETSKLREVCRSRGGTVQGAISVASILARIKVLTLDLPRLASIQVPINCRGLVDDKSFLSTCLCGSAGVVHTVELNPDDDIMEKVRICTEGVRKGLELGQPREWLHKLMNNPAALPPYSLMASSVGVVPELPEVVHEFKFFGGALDTGVCVPTAKSTMVHALTFRGELTCMFNYTYPGVSHDFAKACAANMKDILQKIVRAVDAKTTVIDVMK